MTHSPRQRRLVLDTYDEIVRNPDENGLELLHSTIESLQNEGANIAEMSLLYCLESKHCFESGSYDDAYKWVKDAYELDSERKEVLQSLITLHLPRNDPDISGYKEHFAMNPYEDFEKAKEYAFKLQDLYSNDPKALYQASQCFSTLGLYDDSLRVLKQAFFKLTASMKQKMRSYSQSIHDDKELVEEIKKAITQCYVDRYSNCPNGAHESIIKYLIELIEWKYNNFDSSNLQNCIEEIWERIEYILEKHLDLITDENINNINDINLKWNKISKLLSSIPSSVPLSTKLLNLVYEIFYHHEQYQFGIEFFTRLITEYQTYNDNMLTIHARFEKYDILYLNRAKLYNLNDQIMEMMEDIDQINTRILCDNQDIDQVTPQNLLTYTLNDDDEKPMIETVPQIKKRRASRLSNITISPMPKQYRDLHLTPKSGGPGDGNRNHKAQRRRFYSTQSDLNHFDENKDSEESSMKLMRQRKNEDVISYKEEFYKLQDKYRLLENNMVDLKNDLFRETSKSNQYQSEIGNLQQKIVKMTENLNLHIMANHERQDMETSCHDGEKQEYQSQEEKYMEGYDRLKTEINKRDILISELKMENQSYCTLIQSLKKENGILRDCKKKNSMHNYRKQLPQKKVFVYKGKKMEDHDVNNAKQSGLCRCCGVCWKLVKLLMILVIFFVVCFTLMVIMDDADASSDMLDNVNIDGYAQNHKSL